MRFTALLLILAASLGAQQIVPVTYNTGTGRVARPVSLMAVDSVVAATPVTITPATATVEGWLGSIDSIVTTATGDIDTLESTAIAIQAQLDAHEANQANPHAVTKTQVGLVNADNTPDSAKPVSSYQAAAIAVVQNDVNTHEARTDDPHSVTAAQVGLENADNTSDADKPISTAAQVALNAKQNSDADLDDLADGSLGGAKVGFGIDAANISNGVIDPNRLATGTSLQILRRNAGNTALEYATISAGGGDISAASIDTLAELNAIVGDATLIDGDLSQSQFAARAPRRALVSDGTGDLASIPTGKVLVGTADFTIGLWLNLDDYGTGISTNILGNSGVSTTASITAFRMFTSSIASNGIGLMLRSAVGGTLLAYTTEITIADKSWVNLAITVDKSGFATWYLNGQAVGTPVDISAQEAETYNSAHPFEFLSDINSARSSGSLGETWISSTLATAAQIASIHTNGTARDSGLTMLAHWEPSLSQGVLFEDISGNNLHAILGTTGISLNYEIVEPVNVPTQALVSDGSDASKLSATLNSQSIAGGEFGILFEGLFPTDGYTTTRSLASASASSTEAISGRSVGIQYETINGIWLRLYGASTGDYTALKSLDLYNLLVSLSNEGKRVAILTSWDGDGLHFHLSINGGVPYDVTNTMTVATAGAVPTFGDALSGDYFISNYRNSAESSNGQIDALELLNVAPTLAEFEYRMRNGGWEPKFGEGDNAELMTGGDFESVTAAVYSNGATITGTNWKTWIGAGSVNSIEDAGDGYGGSDKYLYFLRPGASGSSNYIYDAALMEANAPYSLRFAARRDPSEASGTGILFSGWAGTQKSTVLFRVVGSGDTFGEMALTDDTWRLYESNVFIPSSERIDIGFTGGIKINVDSVSLIRVGVTTALNLKAGSGDTIENSRAANGSSHFTKSGGITWSNPSVTSFERTSGGRVANTSPITFSNATSSTNTTTGAAVIGGGLGVAENINAGGNVTGVDGTFSGDVTAPNLASQLAARSPDSGIYFDGTSASKGLATSISPGTSDVFLRAKCYLDGVATAQTQGLIVISNASGAGIVNGLELAVGTDGRLILGIRDAGGTYVNGLAEATASTGLCDVVAVRTGTTVNLYVNGLLVATETHADWATALNVAYVKVGLNAGSDARVRKGDLRLAEYGNVSLTADEVLALHRFGWAALPQYVHADGGQTIYTSDFSVGVDSWINAANTALLAGNIDGIGGRDDNLRVSHSSAGVSGFAIQRVNLISSMTGKQLRLVGSIYKTAALTGVTSFQIKDNSGNLLATLPTATDDTWVDFDVSLVGSTGPHLLVGVVGSSIPTSQYFYLRALVLTAVGVAGSWDFSTGVGLKQQDESGAGNTMTLSATGVQRLRANDIQTIKSPNGTVYKLEVANDGTLSATAL